MGLEGNQIWSYIIEIEDLEPSCVCIIDSLHMDNLNRDFKTKGRVIVLNYLKSHAASIQVFMGHRDNIYRRVMVELKLLSSQPSPLGKGKGRSTKKT